ncbi:MAG: phosphatidate cytidylyltransferase [Muribaculaceae bacterium]
MNKLLKRSASGLVYVGAIVGAIFAGNLWFALLCMVFAAIGIHEFQNATTDSSEKATTLGRIINAGDIVIVLLALSLSYSWTDVRVPGVMIDICGIALIVLLLAKPIVTLYDKRATALRHLAFSVLSLIYILVPLLSLHQLYASPGSAVCLGEGVGAYLVMTLFILIWLNDTGAYCVGSLIGKRRLFERLSPKKSWEGFFGGLGFSSLGSWLCFSYLGTLPQMELGAIGSIAIGAAIAIAATWGDLFESLIKRTAGIKDSGTLIPGHGGVLDRIDSLLIAAPWMVIIVSLI